MKVRKRRPFIAFAVLFCAVQCAYAQDVLLEWAPCAVDCIEQVTAPIADCQEGFRCFCNDQPLYELAIECWHTNCTIRQALTSRNITSTTCAFPDSDIGVSGTAVTFASMGLALVFVGMQLMVFATTRSWGWDDVLIAVGTTMMIGNAVCNPIARASGFGKDAWRIPFENTDEILKIFYAGGIVYVCGVAVTKMAFLCFYIRLFPTPTLRKIAYPVLALTGLQGLTFMFLFAFQCSPVSYAWLQWDGEAEGTCLGFDIGAAAHAIVNILLDFAIFALPMFQLRTLNLSKKKRWQVLSMFAVGFFVTLVSVLRIPSLVAIGESRNLTRDYIPLGYWSDLELNIGIACFCMPAARVIIRRYFPECGLGSTNAHAGYVYEHDGSATLIDSRAAHPRKKGGGQGGLRGGSGNAANYSNNGTVRKKTISNGKVVDVLSSTTSGQSEYIVGQDGLVAKMPRGHRRSLRGSEGGDTRQGYQHWRSRQPTVEEEDDIRRELDMMELVTMERDPEGLRNYYMESGESLSDIRDERDVVRPPAATVRGAAGDRFAQYRRGNGMV